MAASAADSPHAPGACETRAVLLVHGNAAAAAPGFADLLSCTAHKAATAAASPALSAAPGLIQIFVAANAELLVHGNAAAAAPGFADLLSCTAHKAATAAASPALSAAPGLIQIFVAANAELHLLAWRPRALQRTPLAAIVPVADAHLEPAWRQALVPSADIAAPGKIATGLAAFDGDGLKARFEFGWTKNIDGQWALSDDKATKRGRANQLLEPIAAPTASTWSASCGRCLRYPLARLPAAPQLVLCRRDCLARATPF